MANKEATARIKINKLLESASWRFFPVGSGPANIRLEPSVTIKSSDLDALGENFEKTSKGFIDFLLLDTKGFPLIVLEAKSEDRNPLVGKEQARKYAKSQNCRFVILSNGNLHYFWDLERGNPYLITSFPTPDSVIGYQQVRPNPHRLVEDPVGDDYIVLTQRPNYQSEAAWRNEGERPGYIQANKLRFLRPYQLKAIHALQRAVKDGQDRFLFEMAPGTGKTLTAAAVIKLFLRSGNARRALFLVDRLELEDQARKAFKALLSADFQTVIYKENRDDWRRAEVVVTTVQSLLFNNKYQRLFSPTDFDLVISDEAHRSIGGNARVCVTVGMMTTGYDCTDILNLGLFRPIFSPTDFIQIKGRGTRKHNFLEQLFDDSLKEGVLQPQKSAFKLFDFFANCEYFEEDFNYDEVLKLPRPQAKGRDDGGGTGPVVVGGAYEHTGSDIIASLKEQTIGFEGMKIDRMFFEKFEDTVRENEIIAKAVEAGQWDRVIDYVNREVFDKPEEYYTLHKLRKAAAVDRRLTLREILEKIFGLIPRFKSKDELLEEEFAKFVADIKPQEAEAIPAIKTYFKAYVTSDQVRHIIEEKQFTDLATNPVFSTRDFRAIPAKYRTLIPEYIKDYVSLNQFVA
jgi:hypothetical protein